MKRYIKSGWDTRHWKYTYNITLEFEVPEIFSLSFNYRKIQDAVGAIISDNGGCLDSFDLYSIGSDDWVFRCVIYYELDEPDDLVRDELVKLFNSYGTNVTIKEA